MHLSSQRVDRMHTDRKRVVQVLIELIGNAIKYTDKGRITVKVKEQEQGLIWIKVIDTGQGMSEELKHSLFSKRLIQYFTRERDFSRKNTAGIGLDFSRKILGLIGPFYQVFIKSAEGQGSTFKFMLFSDYEQRKAFDLMELRRKTIPFDSAGTLAPVKKPLF